MNREKSRYLIKFYYIGLKKYYGSQRQKEFLTIEEQILKALIKRKYIKNGEDSGFEVASRTDRYVSARGSAFSFLTDKKLILMEINSALPKEIGLWGYSKVRKDFSSRFNAKSRQYKYIFPFPLSFLKKEFSFDVDLMRKGLIDFKGRHDFQNFSKRDPESSTSVRDIDNINYQVINDYIIIDIISQGFLRQQIRRMVQKLMELGKGEISYPQFKNLFDPSEFHSYQPADPHGLILWDVQYEPSISFTIEEKSKKRMKRYFRQQYFKYNQKANLFGILKQNDFGQ
ncbi:MAG: tRNA pseudouridine(38-40) synthase TruA [Promethearchaeia archaeon]